MDLSLLGFEVPEYTDDVHIPTYWAAMIAKLEELLLDGDGRVAWVPGDLKESIQDEDHGRWLKMDGRELTQAEVEALLDLEAGEADAFIAVIGTGEACKYGHAAAGRIKLADTRRRLRMGAGPAEDGDNSLSVRSLGSVGGAESVKLTGAQSGIKAHNHGVTDPGHYHNVTDPGHAHAATQAAHQHGPGSLQTLQAQWIPFSVIGNQRFVLEFSGGVYASIGVNEQGRQITGATDLAQPAITVGNAKTGISTVAKATGLTVDNVANTEATEAHPNVPPFVTVGFTFIRV